MDPQEKGPTLYDFLSEAELLHYYDSIKSILKIQKTSQLKYVIEEDLIELGMSKPEQRRLKKFYNRHFPHNYLSKIKKLLGPNKREETPAPAPPFVITCLDDCKIADIPPPEPFVKVPNKHIISTEDLTITKELGTGEFGLVQQGIWTDDEDRKIHVAIKCLCRDRMQSSSLEFLKEAAIMHSIEHPDIVRLYGVVLHPDSLMLVTELAPLRSLLECIKEIVLRPTFEITTLCEYAQQICQGMVYLERKRFIHRDLAARNILVFSKDKVKISDFGLSRALGAGKDYYQTNFNANLKLPIAWCAPECITYLKFTSASDVWAYAVTLWEMFSYGIQPWSALSGNQILNAIDAPNFQRLEQPECCPKDYFTLMWRCWRHEPHLRPKFTEIAAMLPNCRPERVEVIAVPQILEKKRSDILNCRIGDVITVLDKSSTRWRGVLLHGKTGYFNPANVKLYIPPPPGKEKDSNDSKESSTNSQLSSNGFRRNSLAEGTSSIQRRLDRNSVRSKGRLRSDMISAPQGEVKHTSHIGLDGAYFGLDDSYLRDVPFMDPACNSPYQLTTHPSIAPYNKQGDDFDHTPLINPNSPSHNAHIYYPMHSRSSHKEANLHRGGSAMSNRNDSHYAGNSDGTEDESRSILKGKPSSFKFDSFNQIRGSKVKWPGKGTKGIKGANKYKYAEQNACFNNGNAAVEEFEPPHEYQEISETEGPSSFFTNEEQHKGRPPPLPESPKVEKTLDFGQSLLDEMESLFRNLNGGSPHQMQRSPATLSHDHDAVNNCNELAELASRLTSSTLSRKKHSSVKPISAHDQRTLDSAIALANELTARSMNDLDHGDPIKTPNSPSERSKFTFKFPLVGGHSHSNSNANGQEYGKYERRNFSKEAQSVPDLQSTITKESRMAYECLIEQPTPTAKDADERRSDSLLRNIPSAAYLKAIVKSGYNPSRLKLPDVSDVHPPIESMERQPVYVEAIGTVRCTSSDVTDKGKTYIDLFTNMKRQPMNMLPLPPRDRSKPQTEKIRHTRKHPLILDALDIHHQPSTDRKPVSTISINATLPKKPPALQFASIVRDTRALPPKPEFQPPIPKRATYENVDRPLLSDAYDHHSLKFEAQLTKSIQEEQVILPPPAPRGDSNRLLNTNEEPIYARVTIARCLPQTQNEDSTGITKQMEGLHLQYIDYDPADDPAYITIEPNNSDDDDSTDGQAADILKPTSTEHNDPEAGPISRDANIKP